MTLTISSVLHGDRFWRRVGKRPHVTRDGRLVVIATWELTCVICGAAFQVTTPGSVDAIEKTRLWDSDLSGSPYDAI